MLIAEAVIIGDFDRCSVGMASQSASILCDPVSDRMLDMTD